MKHRPKSIGRGTTLCKSWKSNIGVDPYSKTSLGGRNSLTLQQPQNCSSFMNVNAGRLLPSPFINDRPLRSHQEVIEGNRLGSRVLGVMIGLLAFFKRRPFDMQFAKAWASPSSVYTADGCVYLPSILMWRGAPSLLRWSSDDSRFVIRNLNSFFASNHMRMKHTTLHGPNHSQWTSATPASNTSWTDDSVRGGQLHQRGKPRT